MSVFRSGLHIFVVKTTLNQTRNLAPKRTSGSIVNKFVIAITKQLEASRRAMHSTGFMLQNLHATLLEQKNSAESNPTGNGKSEKAVPYREDRLG